MMHLMSGTLIRVKDLGRWSEEREEMSDEDRKKAFYRITSKMDNGFLSIKRTTIVHDDDEAEDDDDFNEEQDFDDDEDEDFDDDDDDNFDDDDNKKHSRKFISIEICGKKELNIGQAADEDGEK